MNLEEAQARSKYTMSVHAVGIAWVMGASFSSSGIGLMVTPQRVVSVISALIGVRPHELIERTRKHFIAHPRQVAMMLIRDECPAMSLPEIGRFFGMDHTSVMLGIRRAREHTASGGGYERLYQEAWQILREGSEL